MIIFKGLSNAKNRSRPESTLLIQFISEAVVRKCSVRKVFLQISKNSHENTCVRVSFLIDSVNLFKKRLWYRCFPVNFAKFLGRPFLQKTSDGCFCYFHIFRWLQNPSQSTGIALVASREVLPKKWTEQENNSRM